MDEAAHRALYLFLQPEVDHLLLFNPVNIAKKAGVKTDFRDTLLHLARELRTKGNISHAYPRPYLKKEIQMKKFTLLASFSTLLLLSGTAFGVEFDEGSFNCTVYDSSTTGGKANVNPGQVKVEKDWWNGDRILIYKDVKTGVVDTADIAKLKKIGYGPNPERLMSSSLFGGKSYIFDAGILQKEVPHVTIDYSLQEVFEGGSLQSRLECDREN